MCQPLRPLFQVVTSRTHNMNQQLTRFKFVYHFWGFNLVENEVVSILAATTIGCFEFDENGKRTVEFSGRSVYALAQDADGSCLAVVDGKELWHRNSDAKWLKVRTTKDDLVSILCSDGDVYGATMEPAIIRIHQNGDEERLTGFDSIEGRDEWFQQGPPIHVRSLTKTADGRSMFAAVHVGGIPRSDDGGITWVPTIPVMDDVHEVRAHPSNANIVAAATAYGACVSEDAGRNWTTFNEGLEVSHGLAVAVLEDSVIFSVQEDPFADKSQIWEWRIGSTKIEQVRDGLPEWLTGKVDSNQMTAGKNHTAIVDGGGHLWLSGTDSAKWKCIAEEVPYPLSMLIV